MWIFMIVRNMNIYLGDKSHPIIGRNQIYLHFVPLLHFKWNVSWSEFSVISVAFEAYRYPVTLALSKLDAFT